MSERERMAEEYRKEVLARSPSITIFEGCNDEVLDDAWTKGFDAHADLIKLTDVEKARITQIENHESEMTVFNNQAFLLSIIRRLTSRDGRQG